MRNVAAKAPKPTAGAMVESNEYIHVLSKCLPPNGIAATMVRATHALVDQRADDLVMTLNMVYQLHKASPSRKYTYERGVGNLESKMDQLKVFCDDSEDALPFVPKFREFVSKLDNGPEFISCITKLVEFDSGFCAVFDRSNGPIPSSPTSPLEDLSSSDAAAEDAEADEVAEAEAKAETEEYADDA